MAAASWAMLLAFSPGAAAQTERLDTHEIQRVLDRADYTFYNKLMYTSGQEWIGKTVTFRGTIAVRPVIIPDKRDYIQVSGQNSNNDPVNIVGYLDTPLRSESGYEQRGPTVSRGQNVIVFGILGKPRDFVDESGYVRFLPTMDLLMIYTAEDRDYRMPLWVSRSLRR
ncbi:MAG: hypothetical protein MUE68_01105 [Bacteroidetes bacterium]|nr:hypothetical protein [Bacteroidota bacterium]